MKLLKRGEFARATMVIESVQSLLPSTRLIFVFSTGDHVFARLNLKSAVLKNFVFDWALCFRLCEVYRFQNLVGLELPIKHALREFSLPSVLSVGSFCDTLCKVYQTCNEIFVPIYSSRVCRKYLPKLLSNLERFLNGMNILVLPVLKDCKSDVSVRLQLDF